MPRSGNRRQQRPRKEGSFPYKRRDNNREDMENTWKHDRYDDDGEDNFQNNKRDRSPVPQFGIKVIVSNLKFDVLEEELKVIFAEVGTVLAVKVHYDNTGRSTGEADVVFNSKFEAEAAIKEFNDRSMSGQPLEIKFGGRTPVRDGIILSPRKERENRNRNGGGGGRFRGNNRGGGGRNEKRFDNRNRNGGGGGGGRKIDRMEEENLKIQVNF